MNGLWSLAVLSLILILSGCTASASVDNPWGHNPVEIYIDEKHPEQDDHAPIVRDAMEYWNTDGRNHTPYDVNFSETDDNQSADIVILIRDDVDGLDKCGIEGIFSSNLGCAPIYEDGEREYGQTIIYINRATMFWRHPEAVKVVKHELGHTLGLGHSDDPSFMNATIRY